jgi:hypothetical protein
MRRFRISIAGLMAVVLFISVGFVALRYASDEWAGIVTMLALGILTLAIVGAIYRRGARRAAWVGFALFGWVYLLSASDSSWSFSSFENMITSAILEKLHDVFQRDRITTQSPSILDRLFGFPESRDKPLWAALDKPVPMPFAMETPLVTVLKHVKAVTQSPELPNGIPIYVDPAGLQEAEQTLRSPITLSVDGIPLKSTLALLLKQLDLDYRVKDGLLTITYISSRSDEDTLYPFLRIGHCLFGLLTGLLGAIAGRWFYATRDREPASSPSP